MPEKVAELLDYAHRLAWEAGKIALRYYQTGVETHRKADATPVTVADRAAERFLREAIEGRYPGHAILGEEEGETGPEDAEWRWVLDPIDGTATFVCGSPLFGVMIGVQRRREPTIGVICAPALGEIVYAATGLGCWWNGRRCATSDVAALSDGLVLSTAAKGYERYGKAAAFRALTSRCRMFRTWGDCYGYLMVATGRAEVMLDAVLSPWDEAPLRPILNEAGGTFTDWKGVTSQFGGEGLATNGRLLDEVLRVFGEQTG